jgi:hypothetical protein
VSNLKLVAPVVASDNSKEENDSTNKVVSHSPHGRVEFDGGDDDYDIEVAMAATRAKVMEASSSTIDSTTVTRSSPDGFNNFSNDSRPKSTSGSIAADNNDSNLTPAAQPPSSLNVSILVDHMSPEVVVSGPLTLDTPSPVRNAKLFNIEISDDESDFPPQNEIDITTKRDEAKIATESISASIIDKVDVKDEAPNVSSSKEVRAHLPAEVDVSDWEAPEQSSSSQLVAAQSELAQPQVSQGINISSWEDGDEFVDLSSDADVKADVSTLPKGEGREEEMIDGESLESYSFPVPKDFNGGQDDASQLFVPSETPLFVDLARPVSREDSDEELAAALDNLNSSRNTN